MLKKVIVKQHDQKDCGICCIQSLLKYYNGYASKEKIWEDSYTSKKGTSAYHIVEVLKKYGFDAYGTKIKKENLTKESFPLPAIVHVVLDNGLNHYMVLYEIRKEKVILMDPSCGKKTMSHTDFFWIWSEIAIIAYPKTQIINLPNEKNWLLVANQFLKGNHKELLLLIGGQAFLFLITLISAFYFKLELYFLNQTVEQIIICIVFFLLLILQLIGLKNTLISEININKKLELQHIDSYLTHLFNLSLKKFKNREISDYFTRLWEMFDLKYLYTDVIKNGVISLATISISFIILYLLNEDFFIFFVITTIISFILKVLLEQKSEQLEKNYLKNKNDFAQKMLEELSNVETYVYMNLKKTQIKSIEKDVITYLKEQNAKEKFYQQYAFYQNVLKELGNFCFLSIGIILIEKKKIELIDFFIIESISLNLNNALEKVITMLPKMRYLKQILQKANEFFSIPTEKERTHEDIIIGDLEINNISYSYDQYSYTLKDIKFKIMKGEHVLMLGKSGCGKSTLCKIITRILKPMSGEIKLGGINIEDYNDEDIRSKIIYLPQDSNIKNGTIKENIIMDRSYNFSKFVKVCQICHINDIVEKRPLRYETRLSNNENNLSGGERQRIILARTLMSNANIFLLDESLSEVDEKLEKGIIRDMHEFLKGKTIIYISHKNYKSLFDEVIKLEESHERILI